MQSPIKVFQISLLEAALLCSPPSLLVSLLTLDGRGRMPTLIGKYRHSLPQQVAEICYIRLSEELRDSVGFAPSWTACGGWRWLKYVCAHAKRLWLKMNFWKWLPCDRDSAATWLIRFCCLDPAWRFCKLNLRSWRLNWALTQSIRLDPFFMVWG